MMTYRSDFVDVEDLEGLEDFFFIVFADFC